MTHQMKSVALSTGIAMPYVEQGDPDGIPVVFLHGYSDSPRTWEPLLPQLPRSIHAYAITLRGHGDADRPQEGYDAEQVTADLAAFMDAVGLGAAVLVGHSGGGYTAQRFAVDRPERAHGVVLIATFHDLAANAEVQELDEVVAELVDPVDPVFVREFQESCVAQPVAPAFIDAIVAESLKLPARVWKAVLRGLIEAEVPTRRGTITAPALVLWGDQDPFCPRAEQDAIVGACPDARLSVYEGVGHSVQWEQPARVAAELTAFTASIATEVASHA